VTDLTVAEAGLRKRHPDHAEAAKDLATQMSNGSSSAVDRSAAALAVDRYIEELRGLANTRLEDGRYVFGGTRDGSEPYPAAGGYLGGQNSRMVQIAPGASFDSAVVGSQSFGDYRHRVPGARGLRDSAAQQRPRRDPGRPGHAPGSAQLA
jgi:flagellin-like hook-associated protein FlgL